MDNILIEKIKSELVEKSYYDDIKYNLTSKSRCKLIGDVTEALAKVIVLLGGIIAFSAVFFNKMILSFISGCITSFSVLLLQFSSYAMSESRERTIQVNKMLEHIGLSQVPDIIIDQQINQDKK